MRQYGEALVQDSTAEDKGASSCVHFSRYSGREKP